MNLTELKDNLFLEVKYPDRLTSLIGDAEPWRSFCREPQETKNVFTLFSHQDDSEAGYRLRSKAAGREDKEYFHFYPDYVDSKDGAIQHLAESNSSARSFFEYATAIHQEVILFSNSITAEFGKQLPGLEELLSNGKLRYLLRFLHYTSQTEPVIAAPHFDRSLYTLHLYESAPGLQFLNWDMQWVDAPIKSGTTVLFNGYRLENLTHGSIQKTWHRVIGNESNRGRYSLVLFLWSPFVEDYPHEARSQELTPSYRRTEML